MQTKENILKNVLVWPHWLSLGYKDKKVVQNIICVLQGKERNPYRFGMTWEWVDDAIIFIFRWTIPLSQTSLGGHESSPVVSWTRGSSRFRIVLGTQRHRGCVSMLVGVGSTAAPFCKHGGQCVTGTFLRLHEASVSHTNTHTPSPHPTPNILRLHFLSGPYMMAGSLEI